METLDGIRRQIGLVYPAQAATLNRPTCSLKVAGLSRRILARDAVDIADGEQIGAGSGELA